MAKIVFNNKDHVFSRSVKKEVDAYFIDNHLETTGNWKLYLKAMIFIPAAVILYVFLLTAHYSTIAGLILCPLFGLSLAGIAMNVMHDACHGSFSGRKWINDLMGLSMNALGSSTFLWKIKHNIIHHTYTNIANVDSDIENWPLLRQTPAQKCLSFHRYQHLYMFLLYALSTIHWMLVFDFEKYFSRKFASTPVRHLGLKDHLVFWFSKVLYSFFYIALPIYFLGWQSWLIGFMILHVTMGLVLTIVFQLAHLVEKTSFEIVEYKTRIETEWAVHEVMTTANFAEHNKILSWYLGGLNFQVEHHLFPRTSHIHYPALSKIIQQQCLQFNLPYHSYTTMQKAISSHVRLMKKLGENKYDRRVKDIEL